MPTFARIDASGYAIDVYDAPDTLTLEKRLGVTGFVLVPDGTKNHAAVTLDGDKVASVVNPTLPKEVPPVEAPKPAVSAAVVAAIDSFLSALVANKAATAAEQKSVIAAIGKIVVG